MPLAALDVVLPTQSGESSVKGVEMFHNGNESPREGRAAELRQTGQYDSERSGVPGFGSNKMPGSIYRVSKKDVRLSKGSSSGQP
jgi:hypothetical protein